MAEAANPPKVALIILNWNNPEDTLACLRSVAALAHPALFTLVVDNGSSDDSTARISTSFPDIQILATGANLGYAGGNNVGIRQALAAGAESVCILNNDVVVEPDFLEPLLAALYGQPDIGVVTPLVAETAGGDGRVGPWGQSWTGAQPRSAGNARASRWQPGASVGRSRSKSPQAQPCWSGERSSSGSDSWMRTSSCTSRRSTGA